MGPECEQARSLMPLVAVHASGPEYEILRTHIGWCAECRQKFEEEKRKANEVLSKCSSGCVAKI